MCFEKCVNEMAHISDSWGVCWLLTIERRFLVVLESCLFKSTPRHSERQGLISTLCDIDGQIKQENAIPALKYQASISQI